MKRLLAFTFVALLLGSAAFFGTARSQAPTNLYSTILASGARTATSIITATQTNAQWTRAHVIFNVSAYTSGTYTPTIQAQDLVSGNWYTLLTGPAIGATGMTVLKIGSGFVPLANASAADMLPRTWRVSIVGAATPAMTFSVGAYLE